MVSLVQMFASLKFWFIQKVGLRWFMLFKSHLGKELSFRKWCVSFSNEKKKKKEFSNVQNKVFRVWHKIMYLCSISPDSGNCVIALLDSHHCEKPMPEAWGAAWRNMNILLSHQTFSLLGWGGELFLRNDYIKVFSFKCHPFLGRGQLIEVN